LHDAVAAERLRVPAISVMTRNFVSAAELMARVLGMPDHGFGVIDHPVSSASNDELEQRALVTLEDIRRLILRDAA